MAAASSSLPLAVSLLLLAASAVVPATAAGSGGGRMVIIRAPGTSSVPGGAAAGARSNSEWRQHYRRLEDEVAPELGGLLLGADQRSISYGTLAKDSAACQKTNTCVGPQPGGPYTRPCPYVDQCRGG